MRTLRCPLESKILPAGPQIQRFAGVFVYEHLLLRSREHYQNSSLSLTCYSILDFYYELEIYARQDFPFFSWFQLLSKTISAKTTYGNPLLFGLYNNSQRWEMVKFVKEKGEISRFSCLSRYSRNLSRPGNMFMLVPLVHDVLVDNFRHSFLPDRRAQDFEKIK